MADDERDSPPQGKHVGKLNIKVSDDMAKGSYANLAIIHNNDVEFVLDFVFAEPQRQKGQVVSRVVTNPRTAKRLLVGLTELLRVYEERFGTIAIPEKGPVKGTYH